MDLTARHGCEILLGSLFIFLSLSGIHSNPGELVLDCKNCDPPPPPPPVIPLKVVATAPRAPPPSRPPTSPVAPATPATPPGGKMSTPPGPAPSTPFQGIAPASPQAPTPVTPQTPAGSPAAGPVSSQVAPAPSQTPFAPAPSPNAPAPAPQTPLVVPIIVIAAGGASTISSSNIYTIETGLWGRGPSLSSYGRSGFPMIQLSSTEVLAAGGDLSGAPTAEVFSTTSQSWQATTSMGTTRFQSSMVLLPDGSAFTAGGQDVYGGFILASTELYVNSVWGYGPQLVNGRAYFTMLTYVANSNTAVLVCGGLIAASRPTSSCEQWIPTGSASNTFSLLQTALITPVYNQRAVLLNGAPFITGGIGPDGTPVTVTQVLVNGAWQSTAAMQYPRAGHEMVVLQDGRVLVCGGADSEGGVRTSCEIFSGGTWASSPPPLPSPQVNFRMLVLPSGDVLFYGQAETGFPCSGTWRPGDLSWSSIPASADLPGRQQFGMASV